MNREFDIAVIGSGFSGALMALICRQLGRSVVMLERGSHPRFAIGESSTPLANLLLEELAARYELPRLLPLTKWGTWQDTYPELGCGLKRGFTFLHHRRGEPFLASPDRCNELLVAASPHDAIADTHWFRADFDHFLVREARAAGAEYLEHTRLTSVRFTRDRALLEGTRENQPLAVEARFVIDATGPRGALYHLLDLKEEPFPELPVTEALYSHFTGVHRLGDLWLHGGGESPPYPLDDAAVHHVFEGGWIWVLRFNNRITSAGAALTPQLARELDIATGAPAWRQLVDRLPTVKEQFREASAVLPFRHEPRLPFRSRRMTGVRWALLPSAAGFVDPMLSTGFPMALLGVQRLAGIIERYWESPQRLAALRAYESQTAAELTAAASLIGALYANLDDFPFFAALTKLYFSAASFAETARRLNLQPSRGSFLLHEVPEFSQRCQQLSERAKGALSVGEKRELMEEIENIIAPFDVAGLCDRDRRNWYPANAADLFRAAPGLGVSREEIGAMLRRGGFIEVPA